MRADYRVLIDACVLANFSVCDLLLRLSERPRLITPNWSAEILDEVWRTQTEKLRWPEELANSFNRSLQAAFPEALVSGFEHLITHLNNDAKDRHVLAAAIKGQCPLLLTFNLKDFPHESISPWGISASHPQDYLMILYEMEPKQVIACLGKIAGRRGMDLQDVLIQLGKHLPLFSMRLIDDLC